MQLAVRGHPLHTRALGVTLARRDDGRLDARASLLDLRKRGFVPVAGDLQTAGVVHDMHLAGVVDPGRATLDALAAEQRSVAFEPSAATGGESCRDPIARIAALAGAPLDDGFGKRLGAAIGGARGCSHLLTLAHFLGATAAWAIARDRVLLGTAPERAAGERVLRRDLVIDGHEPAPGRLQLATQLTEVHFAPAPALARPMERFAAELEIRLLAELDVPGFSVGQATIAERRRDRADLGEAAWRPRDDVAAWLAGRRLGAGITGQLLDRLGESAEDRPLLDLLLMLAPALVQCAAALSDAWAVAFQDHPSVVGMGGLTDSCYMWRRDGALARAREAEGGDPPPRL